MAQRVLLILPPFSQGNTPYPSTAYLKGFLNTLGVASAQYDLGLELLLQVFTPSFLEKVFAHAASKENLSPAAQRVLALQGQYIQSIEAVIRFLQYQEATLAYRLHQRGFLPRGARFDQVWGTEVFGSMSLQDETRYWCTLYLEDLGDFIREAVDEHFGFSRYAEQLGRSAARFDQIEASLQMPASLLEQAMLELLEQQIQLTQPTLIGFSVPFPGNLFSALRCAQWIRTHHPHIHVLMGGGFPNTELRSLKEKKIFDYVHFITLDDGEKPLERLLDYLEGDSDLSKLKRTYLLQEDALCYCNDSPEKDYAFHETATPDYHGLHLNRYLSFIETPNPMHRLWQDGHWLKLTMAHGCYWKQCTFCDIHLDYISRYEPLQASLLCDRMEQLIAQTGEHGFHFVDEAAPPQVMKQLALEILRRGLQVSWWTNIRFEKGFGRDLCMLLKASGCIGVSGGLEVASDRILALIRKGVTISQAASVMQNFSYAGIPVHAYLMYGFPTQRDQETIDSLEWVRQFFQRGILQSAFWHRFTMTVHSPVGMHPERFGAERIEEDVWFAANDLQHRDPSGGQHEKFSFGLRKSLLNYMHGIGWELPLQHWFAHKVPDTTIASDAMDAILVSNQIQNRTATHRIVWHGIRPQLSFQSKSKKGQVWENGILRFVTTEKTIEMTLEKEKALWWFEWLCKLERSRYGEITFGELMQDYETQGWDDFDLFWYNKPMASMCDAGLWVV